ncbi:hypothetical protein Arcve_0085 [Archaeoglobus veneficus SNP6]|uniref:DUF4065 domain-containing protein n=2 Tax=Archaeoglobus veneficus TaxID=58290 RepID=F2KMV2_ARCVS|nr:hypothetical protein Arcve_0085 [Archaeoglobus veneficus SNP6]
MKNSDLILYVVKKLNEVGSWAGNTHLQKIIYLIQSTCNIKLYDFVLYHYGPYSFDLREDVDLLTISNYLERDVDEFGYHYRLSSVLEPSIPSEIRDKVDRIVKVFGKAPTTLLELITTVDYVARKSPGKSDNEIVEIVKKIKPHFSERAIELALKWLKEDFKKIFNEE